MGWRERAGTVFSTEKSPAVGARGMVVANHPLASAAGVQMLADGGNAVDAAVATLFALSVVEPMMVGLFGAGWTNIRLADGTHVVLDNYSTAPAAAAPDLYEPVSDDWPDYLTAVGRRNEVGYSAVGVPGTLKAWTEVAQRWGRLDLPTLLQPAIGYAERGFRVSEYLSRRIVKDQAELAGCPQASAVFLPGGQALEAGVLLRQGALAHTLRTVAAEGADSLYGGALGQAVVDDIRRHGGIMTIDDLRAYRTVERPALTGHYRGYDITVPPPPCSGGLHILQILRLLEGFDVAAMGFGSAQSAHLLAECFKIAFSDRAAHVGDPDVAPVPVDWLVSEAYADQRRAEIDLTRASTPQPGAGPAVESANTTHVTVADADGNVVAMTQTINAAFGAKVMAAGTGLLLNNTMAMFDPHPGHANSVGPRKRMVSSMSPVVVSRGGRPFMALGTPGGVRIFPSILQAIVNVVDHGMSLQEAVEAPRVWTQGQELEVEQAFSERLRDGLRARGHDVVGVGTVAGGMNGIQFSPDGSTMTGAACWRADGAPAALSGGHARPGVQFRTTARR